MIGLLAVQALKLAGCGRVIAVDVDDARLRMAAGLGADAQVNSTSGGRGGDRPRHDRGPRRRPRARGGRRHRAVPDRAGLRAQGRALTLVGNLSPKVELPLQSVVTRQIRVQGSCASSGEYPACIDLLARGAIRVEPLISAKAPLAEGPQWFERLYNREPNLMKVILQP